MENLFLVVFRIGKRQTFPQDRSPQALYTLWTRTKRRNDCLIGARRQASRRNRDIPGETTDLVALYEVGVDMTQADAEEYRNTCYRIRDRAGFPHPEDISAEHPILFMHNPVIY
jgi:hypothetical protein